MLDFSIVIPTYARPQRLAAALAAIKKLQWQPDRFEVIVVDDGSPVPVNTDLSQLNNLTIIRQTNQGPAAARNIGAQAAKGEYLAFTDDDCAPHPLWLKEMKKAHAKNRSQMIGGHTRNGLPDNVYSSTSEHLCAFLTRSRDGKAPTFFASNNMSMSRQHFNELGGFDISYSLAAGEDREFCRRWCEAGFTLKQAPTAIVEHFHHFNLKSFLQQHFNYGRGAALFHGKKQRPPESLGFYLRLITHQLNQGWGISQLQQTALLGLSQVAVTGGFLWESNRPRTESRRTESQRVLDFPNARF